MVILTIDIQVFDSYEISSHFKNKLYYTKVLLHVCIPWT